MIEEAQSIEQLLEIAETGLVGGSKIPSLESQLKAIIALSKSENPLAEAYVLNISKYLDYRDPRESGDDLYYPLTFKFPNAKGLLGADLQYKAYVNDTAPSPQDFGMLPCNASGKIIRQCIARVKARNPNS